MSPRTGRPKVEKPKYIKFSIRLDFDMHTLLEQYCKENNISKATAIRNGLQLLFTSKK